MQNKKTLLSNEKDNASIFMKDGFAYVNAGGAILRIESAIKQRTFHNFQLDFSGLNRY